MRAIPYHVNLSTLSCKGLLPHLLFTKQTLVECLLHGWHLGYSSTTSHREAVILTMSSPICPCEDFGFYFEKEEEPLESFG